MLRTETIRLRDTVAEAAEAAAATAAGAAPRVTKASTVGKSDDDPLSDILLDTLQRFPNARDVIERLTTVAVAALLCPGGTSRKRYPPCTGH